MQRQATSSGKGQNALIEESVLFRIQQLQNGLLQFTDSTTAYRLVKEFGKDIRYIAPWKKWIIWNGNYWEVTTGRLFITWG